MVIRTVSLAEGAQHYLSLIGKRVELLERKKEGKNSQQQQSGSYLQNQKVIESDVKVPPHVPVEVDPHDAIGMARGVVDPVLDGQEAGNAVKEDVLEVEELRDAEADAGQSPRVFSPQVKGGVSQRAGVDEVQRQVGDEPPK